jgi:hypothetical protein
MGPEDRPDIDPEEFALLERFYDGQAEQILEELARQKNEKSE